MATLTSVTGNVKQTSTVTKGSGKYDNLPFNNIVSIDEVFTEGSKSVTYNKGTDYQLSGHTQIKWLTGGKAPSNGSSYRVTYTHNKQLLLLDFCGMIHHHVHMIFLLFLIFFF